MKIIISKILIAVSLAIIAGCGTLVVAAKGRDEILKDKNPQLWRIYTRTNWDLGAIYFPFWAFFGNYEEKGDSVHTKSFAVLLGPFAIVLGAIDLPLALVCDTFTLPWDYKDLKTQSDNETVAILKK